MSIFSIGSNDSPVRKKLNSVTQERHTKLIECIVLDDRKSVKILDNIYLIDDKSFNLGLSNRVYSLTTNSVLLLDKPIKDNSTNRLLFSLYKPNITVTGYLINNKLVVHNRRYRGNFDKLNYNKVNYENSMGTSE